MLTLGTLIVVGLATWQAVEIYRHSPLFKNWRYILQGPEDAEPSEDDPLAQLFSCGWCLSVWVATILVILAFVPVLNCFVYGLAISRIANVLHDAYRYLEDQNDIARQERERRLEQESLELTPGGSIKLNSSTRTRQDD